jgi:hypothetical protein
MYKIVAHVGQQKLFLLGRDESLPAQHAHFISLRRKKSQDVRTFVKERVKVVHDPSYFDGILLS